MKQSTFLKLIWNGERTKSIYSYSWLVHWCELLPLAVFESQDCGPVHLWAAPACKRSSGTIEKNYLKRGRWLFPCQSRVRKNNNKMWKLWWIWFLWIVIFTHMFYFERIQCPSPHLCLYSSIPRKEKIQKQPFTTLSFWVCSIVLCWYAKKHCKADKI